MRDRNHRGAVLTEAAFALPITLAILCGIVDYAISFADYSAFLSAFHQAARQASIEASPCENDEALEERVSTAMEGAFHALIPGSSITIQATVDSGDPLNPNLDTSATRSRSCLFCIFFFARQSESAEYHSAITMPFERRASCD